MAYEIGTQLCDMHDNYKHLPADLALVSELRIYTDKSAEIMQMLVEDRGIRDAYINKMLVVIEERSHNQLLAAYSYDGRNLNFVTLQQITPAAGSTT